MSFRADIYVVWTTSPRIIYVEAPSVEVSMQDLYDTLRILEAEHTGMDEPPIVSAGGKEVLDATTAVGLTVKLLNAKLGFESRVGPTYEQCVANGGNFVAVDENDLPTSPVYPTAFTQVVISQSSSATLLDGGGGGGLSPAQDATLTQIDENVIILDGKVDIIDSNVDQLLTDVAVIDSNMTDVWKAHFHRRTWNKINLIQIYEVDGFTVWKSFDTNTDLSDINPQ
jgi:hypothetical protein